VEGGTGFLLFGPNGLEGVNEGRGSSKKMGESRHRSQVSEESLTGDLGDLVPLPSQP